MKNFIFKSSEEGSGLVKKFFLILETIQTEQRHQRNDLAFITRKLLIIINDMKLQKQVDEYFDRDETSPQTDSDNK